MYDGSEILPGPQGLFGVHTSKREFFTLSAKQVTQEKRGKLIPVCFLPMLYYEDL